MLQWAKTNLFGGPALIPDPTDLPFSSLTLQFDFPSRTLLECGGYGKVFKIARRTTREIFALKEVPIQNMNNPDLARNIQRERIALKMFDSPFIIKLHSTYQTADTVYFLLDLASEGDLFDKIAKNYKPLKLSSVRFVAAEQLMALDYLRQHNIIHRDIKAENVLIDCNFHTKLSDFGNAKLIGQPQGSSLAAQIERNSATGTPNLVAPEVWYKEAVSFGTDYWGLGFLVFQMYTRTFLAEFKRGTKADDYFDTVELQQWHYPFDQPDPELHNLVSQVTRHSADDRLGTSDIEDLMQHQFFHFVDLANLQHTVPPGFDMTDDDACGWCEAKDVPPMSPPPPPQPQPPPSALAPRGAEPESPSQGSSPDYPRTKGSLAQQSPVKNITQSMNELWRPGTPPARVAPPIPSSAPAASRRRPLSVLGAAAKTPPSMSLTRCSDWATPPSHTSSASYHSAVGSPGQASPVRNLFGDLWQRTSSPDPEDQ